MTHQKDLRSKGYKPLPQPSALIIPEKFEQYKRIKSKKLNPGAPVSSQKNNEPPAYIKILDSVINNTMELGLKDKQKFAENVRRIAREERESFRTRSYLGVGTKPFAVRTSERVIPSDVQRLFSSGKSGLVHPYSEAMREIRKRDPVEFQNSLDNQLVEALVGSDDDEKMRSGTRQMNTVTGTEAFSSRSSQPLVGAKRGTTLPTESLRIFMTGPGTLVKGSEQPKQLSVTQAPENGEEKLNFFKSRERLSENLASKNKVERITESELRYTITNSLVSPIPNGQAPVDSKHRKNFIRQTRSSLGTTQRPRMQRSGLGSATGRSSRNAIILSQDEYSKGYSHMLDVQDNGGPRPPPGEILRKTIKQRHLFLTEKKRDTKKKQSVPGTGNRGPVIEVLSDDGSSPEPRTSSERGLPSKSQLEIVHETNEDWEGAYDMSPAEMLREAEPEISEVKVSKKRKFNYMEEDTDGGEGTAILRKLMPPRDEESMNAAMKNVSLRFAPNASKEQQNFKNTRGMLMNFFKPVTLPPVGVERPKDDLLDILVEMPNETVINEKTISFGENSQNVIWNNESIHSRAPDGDEEIGKRQTEEQINSTTVQENEKVLAEAVQTQFKPAEEVGLIESDVSIVSLIGSERESPKKNAMEIEVETTELAPKRPPSVGKENITPIFLGANLGSQSQRSAFSKQSDISIVSQLLEEYNKKACAQEAKMQTVSKMYEELASLTEDDDNEPVEQRIDPKVENKITFYLHREKIVAKPKQPVASTRIVPKKPGKHQNMLLDDFLFSKKKDDIQLTMEPQHIQPTTLTSSLFGGPLKQPQTKMLNAATRSLLIDEDDVVYTKDTIDSLKSLLGIHQFFSVQKQVISPVCLLFMPQSRD
eukprot:TRINITY_DN9872_c0_g1_i1.p1 TRINITY_DN9872_c0_g1~~TRINITY_DN9872_c0_g1_i1.p1  ORF type:complete len:875 (-),score=174.38 TRINITY_DN9872_c0_g1_i1:116-2740(-)